MLEDSEFSEIYGTSWIILESSRGYFRIFLVLVCFSLLSLDQKPYISLWIADVCLYNHITYIYNRVYVYIYDITYLYSITICIYIYIYINIWSPVSSRITVVHTKNDLYM